MITQKSYKFSGGVGNEIPRANEGAPDDDHRVEEHDEREGDPGAVASGVAGFLQPLQKVVGRRLKSELRSFLAGDLQLNTIVTKIRVEPTLGKTVLNNLLSTETG